MKHKANKALSIILASSMVFSTTAFGANFTDTINHWASKQVDTWSEYGVVNGYDGLFRPEDTITRGEMAVLIDKVMKYQVAAENNFDDLGRNLFYTLPVLKANEAGVMNGYDGMVRPNDNITREEASVLICQAFGIDPTKESNVSFVDSNKISNWAKPYVNALSNLGYINGKGNNDFDPQGSIKRGEAVTMLDNIVKAFYSKADTYSENVSGTVVINTPDVNLKDMHIKGDLILAEGVGNGDIILDNVIVDGEVIVRGGGENSVHVNGNSKIKKIKAARKDSKVRIKVATTATVEVVVVIERSTNVAVEGKVGDVQVLSVNITVDIRRAKIQNLTVISNLTTVIVDEDSDIENATLSETAIESKIVINGKIKNLTVNSEKSKVHVDKKGKVENVKVAEKAEKVEVKVDGEATNVEINSSGSTCEVGETGKVDDITVNEKAEGTDIKINGEVKNIVVNAIKVNINGNGKVVTIKVNANDCIIKIKITGKVIIAKGVTGTKVNDKEEKGDITIDFTITVGGGSTGGGSSTTDEVVTKVTLNSVEADGVNGEVTTTKLTLNFDKAISGLTANHIKITDGTGTVIKGDLEKVDSKTYKLGVTVENAGNIEVEVIRPNTSYTIVDGKKNVTVYKAGQTAAEITGVTVTPATATIGIGGTQQLTANVIGTGDFNNTVTWSSSDSNIATVDASTGIVTGMSKGTAVITATSNGNSTIKGTAVITVTEDVQKEQVTITLTEVTNSIEAPDKYIISSDIPVADLDNIEWSCDSDFITCSEPKVVNGVVVFHYTIDKLKAASVTTEKEVKFTVKYKDSANKIGSKEIPVIIVNINNAIGSIVADAKALLQDIDTKWHGNCTTDHATLKTALETQIALAEKLLGFEFTTKLVLGDTAKVLQDTIDAIKLHIGAVSNLTFGGNNVTTVSDSVYSKVYSNDSVSSSVYSVVYASATTVNFKVTDKKFSFNLSVENVGNVTNTLDLSQIALSEKTGSGLIADNGIKVTGTGNTCTVEVMLKESIPSELVIDVKYNGVVIGEIVIKPTN